MVKKAAKAEINAFVRGLITEANPLNFPENASVDEVNFELDRDGSRSRRLGMDYESGYMLRSPTLSAPVTRDTPIQTFEWENAGSIPGKTLLVVQILNSLDFFDLSLSPVSASGFLGNIVLTSTPSSDNRYSLASVDGRLVVVDGSGDISIVSFDGTSFTQETKRIRVRDTWGISYEPTDNDPTFTPTVNSDFHKYNLYNQSWGLPRRNYGNAGAYVDPMTLYRTEYSKYPSDSEVVYTGLQLQPVSPPSVPTERLFINLYKEQFGITVKASRGYFLIDLLRRGASRASEVATNATKHPEMEMQSLTCPQDYTPNGANVVCEFAGRVFYAGFSGTVVDGDGRSPDLSNYIAFSMLVKNKNDIVKCYQEGDPTSREGSDLVDTDGGLIRISGADGILQMINIGTNLVVFARNGVWVVSGGSDYGFSATNYKVSRITKFGLLSANSVVQETGRAFYWSTDGIYAIVPTQVGDLTVENITETTIQTLYESISTADKSRVKGTYDLTGKKIRWIYTQDVPEKSTYVTTELIFDTVLKAFYKHEIVKFSYQFGPEIAGIFKSPPFSFSSTLSNVTAGGVDVIANGNPVVYGVSDSITGVKSTRYLSIEISGGIATYTFANYSNGLFRDWQGVNGVGIDAKAYLLTGAITAGDSSIAKQAPYLVMHFERTEDGLSGVYEPTNPSSCLVRSQWDFTNTINSNKWGPLFQAYRYSRAFIPESTATDFDNGYEIVTSKNKLRGRGRALSLYMETESGKDCRIMGWSLTLNGNSVT
jgi:hypothetical protein